MQLSPWDAAAIGIKTILYAATLCAGGGVLFMLYSNRLMSLDQHRQIGLWVGLCVAVALIASGARILIVAGSMGDGAAGLFDSAMLRMVLHAGEARSTGIRVAGLLLMGVVLLSAPRKLWLAAFGALIAVTSFAWIGHAWAAKAGGLPVALLSLHLLGVAFWLGALAPLLLIARGGDLPRLAATAARFGSAALVVVPALIAAGVSLLWIFLSRFSEIWMSDYGRAITLKLVLVACLLSVAAFNKLCLTPRLLANDKFAAAALKKSILFEMAMGGLILLITATVTTLWSPDS